MHCQAQSVRRTKHVKKPRKTSTQLEHVTIPVLTRVSEVVAPVKQTPVKAEPVQPKGPSKKQLKRQRAMQKKEEAKNGTDTSTVPRDEDNEMTGVKDDTTEPPESDTVENRVSKGKSSSDTRQTVLSE